MMMMVLSGRLPKSMFVCYHLASLEIMPSLGSFTTLVFVFLLCLCLCIHWCCCVYRVVVVLGVVGGYAPFGLLSYISFCVFAVFVFVYRFCTVLLFFWVWLEIMPSLGSLAILVGVNNRVFTNLLNIIQITNTQMLKRQILF